MSKLAGPPVKLRAYDYDASTVSDEELIAAQGAGSKIAVMQLVVQGANATVVTFESGTATGKHTVPAGAGGGCVLPYTGVPWFICDDNEALTYTTTVGGVSVQVAAATV